MKLTKSQLIKIIKEELEAVLKEAPIPPPMGEKQCPPEQQWDSETGKCVDLYEEEKDWMQRAFSKKKGSLHKALGVPEDEDISVTKMASALRKGGSTEKKARAAVNANPDKYGSIKDVGVEKKKKD